MAASGRRRCRAARAGASAHLVELGVERGEQIGALAEEGLELHHLLLGRWVVAEPLAVAESAAAWREALRRARSVAEVRPLLYSLHATCAAATELHWLRPSGAHAVATSDGRPQRVGGASAARGGDEAAARERALPSVTAALEAWSVGWVARVESSETCAQLALRVEVLAR